MRVGGSSSTSSLCRTNCKESRSQSCMLCAVSLVALIPHFYEHPIKFAIL